MNSLARQLMATGLCLFRWRSYVPVALFIPLLVEMRNFDWPLHSHVLQFAWELGCLCLSLVGVGVRAVTVAYVPRGTSGRSTKRCLVRTLNTTGMYSVVRHPLYLGNFLIWLGIALFISDWRLLVIFVLAFWLYYERIMLAEEEFLRRKFGQQFSDWAARTPTFIPRWSGWQRPSRPFSLQMVLKREYTTVYGVSVAFFVLDFLADWVVTGELHFELLYSILLILASVLYVTLRTLKKRTRFLRPREREIAADGA